MATRPALPDPFANRPLQTQSDVAYGNTLDGPDAPDARRANGISRAINLPAPAITADLNGFEQQAKNEQTLGIVNSDPHIASFLGDLHTASSVKDDLPSLANISAFFNPKDGDPLRNRMRRDYSTFSAKPTIPWQLSSGAGKLPPPPKIKPRPTIGDLLTGVADLMTGDVTAAHRIDQMHSDVGAPTLGEWLGSSASGIFGNIEQSAQGAATYLADAIGEGDALRGSPIYKSLGRQAAEDQAAWQQTYNKIPSYIGKQAFSADQSVALMGLSILTGKPIAAMGIQQGAQEYQQVRDRGGSPNEALLAGTISGAAESGFEKYFGLGWMLGNFGKKATGKFVGGLLMREVPSEVATTAVQDAIDAMVTGGGGMKGLKERLPQDLLDTAVSTALLSGAAGPGHFLMHRMSPEAQGLDEIQQAAAGAEFVDGLMKAAEQSKTKAEDPETLKAFIDHRTQDSPVRNVYVPVEAAVAYMQSEKYGGELDRYGDQIAQAQQTQGDVVIPISDAVAHLSGTPAWDALREDVRIEPGGLSRKEAVKQHADIIANMEARGKEIAQEASDLEGQRSAATEVYDEVKNRLRIAGVDDRQSDAVAQIYAARYEARAARRGGTPMEQFKASKISFPKEKAGQFAGREVAQLPEDVLKDNGKPVRFYHATTAQFEDYRAGDGTGQGGDELGRGVYFTGDPAFASAMTNESVATAMREGRKAGPLEGANIRPAYLRLSNPYRFQPGDPIGPALEKKAREGGHDGIIFGVEGSQPNLHDRYREVVVFDPSKIVQDVRRYGQGPRGTTTFTSEGDKLIQLFGTADRSTLLHETGHIWLEEMKADATAKDATPEDKADWETVTKWFASQGAPITKDGFIPTEAHEVWARGVERYFMEGKSPSLGLAGVFRTFKSWLLRIYGVVQNLQAPITPEVREVMDRLIATDQAIEDARRHNAGAQPLFKSAEEAGMTDAEFADYQSRVQNARDEAYDALLYKTMESIRRQRTEEIRSERAAIRAEVGEKIAQQPQFRLLHLLRTGKWLGEPEREATPVKLNSGWLIDNYGEDIFDKLPRGIQIWAGNGETGDTVAEMVGMGSGAEVVNTLVGLRAASDELRATGETRSLRDKLVADETDRIMAERYGDTLTDGTIEEEAIAAINSARQGEIIASEARQLAKRKHVLGVPTPYQFAREWARRTVAAGQVRDVASRSALQRYIRSSNKAARLAEEAILAGDVDEAYRQKQAQLLNHALLAEAKAAADRVDKIVARMQRLAKRAAMKSVDPAYLERVHMLLENYDFRPRSQRSIDEQESLQKWAEGQRAKGYEVHIPPRLDDNGTPYSRVSVQELDSLSDLVESLIAVGRTKQKIRIAQKERAFAEVRDEMIAHLKQLPDRKLPDKVINERASLGSRIASDFVKVEKLAEEMDGGPTGPFNDLLATGARDAENKRHELRNMVLQPIAEMYHKIGRKHWHRLQERVTIPELTWNAVNEGDPRQGTTVTITRSELLAIFMNMGNLSNLEKLSRGERWPVETLKAVMDRELTKDDYDLAQTMWDQVGKLWPSIVETEREMSGIVPESVVNSPIDTQFGTYAGGYWPVVYDPSRWQAAEDMEGKQLDDMFGIKSGVATQKGHTITRTGAFGPINLSLERVLFNHVEQVITRNSYASFARDVLRVLRNSSIRGWIDTKIGPEYRKQIEPWLQQQINAGLVNAKAARWWEKVLRQFRINTQIAAMGLRWTVLAAQAEGLYGSADRIGAKWVGIGMASYARHPIDVVRFVLENSKEMRFRNEAVTRETAEMSARMRGKHSWFTTIQNGALAPIGWADRYTVSVPTWMGAYHKAMSQGMTHEEGVDFADKSVRMSQGAGTPKDLSAVQARLGEGSRFFTMFYSPFNVMFNQQWAGIRAAKRGDPVPLLKTTFYWVVLTSLSDALLHGDWPKWDEEDIGKWFARNVFFGLWAGVPIVRDLANWGNQTAGGQYAGDPGSTPVGRTLTSITKAIADAVKWEKTGQAPKSPIKEAANTTAVVAGVPISQIGTAAQFLWDEHTGEQNAQSVSDWYFGLTKGKVPQPK